MVRRLVLSVLVLSIVIGAGGTPTVSANQAPPPVAGFRLRVGEEVGYRVIHPEDRYGSISPRFDLATIVRKPGTVHPAFPDWDGDGDREAVLIRTGGESPRIQVFEGRRRVETTMLGTEKLHRPPDWTWMLAHLDDDGEHDALGVRFVEGGMRVAGYLSGEGYDRLRIRRTVPTEVMKYRNLWTHDHDGDGLSELGFMTAKFSDKRSKLVLFDGASRFRSRQLAVRVPLHPSPFWDIVPLEHGSPEPALMVFLKEGKNEPTDFWFLTGYSGYQRFAGGGTTNWKLERFTEIDFTI